MATKNASREILGVLRKFEVAGVLNVPKQITGIQEFEPRAGVRVVGCVFEKVKYFVIFDDHADDDTYTLKEYIKLAHPDIEGHFIKNPHEQSFNTYGISHKFRDVYLFEVVPLARRLDVELADRYPAFSRSTIQKYIKAGYVSVNGIVAVKSKQDVIETDSIVLKPQEQADHSEKDLPIIYSDDYVVVVNKPAGILTHSKGVMNTEFTVADFFRRFTHFGLETNRPGVIHRLDRDTSGVIIGARDESTASLLKKQFADRLVKKTYLAVVSGVPKEMAAKIDLPIGRNPSAPSTFRVDPSGKPAITYYEVLATNGKQSLVLLKPESGRTHQLRVHMHYINTPILGDKVYGTKKVSGRLFLHALRVEVTSPISQRREFEAPVPKEFVDLFPEAKNV